MLAVLAMMVQATTAVPPTIDDDLTCIAVVSMAMKTTPVEQRTGLVGGMMYFMGRIDHAAPGYDYAANIARLLKEKDGAAKIAAAAPRCAEVMRERGASMQQWGAKLRDTPR